MIFVRCIGFTAITVVDHQDARTWSERANGETRRASGGES